MKTTTKYEKAILDMCSEFCARHGYNTHVTAESFVGCVIGDILEICDEYWDVQDIYFALKYQLPTEMISDWYYAELDKAMEGTKHRINLRNYWLI